MLTHIVQYITYKNKIESLRLIETMVDVTDTQIAGPCCSPQLPYLQKVRWWMDTGQGTALQNRFIQESLENSWMHRHDRSGKFDQSEIMHRINVKVRVFLCIHMYCFNFMKR